jgi:hypothetical protein
MLGVWPIAVSTAQQLRALVSDPVIFPGLGRNAHVEDPAALWPLLRRLARSL